MIKYLIIGIVIRLLIISFTFHHDTQFFVYTNYLLSFKHLWLRIYDYAGSSLDPLAQVMSPTAFTYPPLIFLINGLFATFLSPLQNFDFVRNFILDYHQQLGNPQTFWLLFLTKAPLLLPDLVLGYLLSNIVTHNAKLATQNSQLIFKLWLLNPITIYATFAIGQFDIYPTLATVAAIWFIQKKLPFAAAASLGIGGAFKMFPLLLLPILALHQGKTWTQKFLLLLTGLVAYLLPLIPYLSSTGFRTYALLAPQTEKMLFSKIPLTGAEYLSIFVVVYALIVLASHHRLLPLWKYFFAVLLLFFSVTHFHPQWFIWTAPWLILFYVEHRSSRWAVYTLLIFYLIIILSFESSLNYALISPLIPNLDGGEPLTSFLPSRLEPYTYLSIIRSLFAGTCFYIAIILFQSRASHEQKLSQK